MYQIKQIENLLIGFAIALILSLILAPYHFFNWDVFYEIKLDNYDFVDTIEKISTDVNEKSSLLISYLSCLSLPIQDIMFSK